MFITPLKYITIIHSGPIFVYSFVQVSTRVMNNHQFHGRHFRHELSLADVIPPILFGNEWRPNYDKQTRR